MPKSHFLFSDLSFIAFSIKFGISSKMSDKMPEQEFVVNSEILYQIWFFLFEAIDLSL